MPSTASGQREARSSLSAVGLSTFATLLGHRVPIPESQHQGEREEAGYEEQGAGGPGQVIQEFHNGTAFSRLAVVLVDVSLAAEMVRSEAASQTGSNSAAHLRMCFVC